MSIFSDLRLATENEPAGYRGFDKYPSAYQAAEFPAYGSVIRITGNNQAFFFVSGIKDLAGQIIDVQLQTAALKKLIGNVVGQGTTAKDRPLMILQIDADVFENPGRFVSKYQRLRSEPGQSKREEFLGKEVALIKSFGNQDGVMNLAKEVFREKAQELGNKLSEADPEGAAKEFLFHNFRIEGVRTEKALSFATWEITSNEGVFGARQEYKDSTYMVDRPWQLGVEPELTHLAVQGHSGAKQVLEAVRYTRELETVDLTLGQLPGRAPLAKPQTTPDAKPR